LFDTLFAAYDDLSAVKPGLALAGHPNKNATVWTLELRPGVTWHDGKPFTADDVVYTVKQWQNPKAFATNGYVASIIDFGGVRKRGRLVVEIPTHIPIAELPSVLWPPSFSVIQNGTTYAKLHTHPIGTGPFKYTSFTPGRQSIFAANRSYWEHGKPYVDKLIINSSFTDEITRYNALLGGEIDAAFAVSPVLAREHANSTQAVVQRARQNNSLTMNFRVDQGPFVDPRVRLALKHLINRPAIIAGALDGFGTVANDVYGAGDRYYDNALKPPSYDPERAKSLLKAAGKTGFTFSMPVAEVLPGYVAAATLYAEQAKAGGVTINVNQVPVGTYFTTSAGYLTRPLAFDYTGVSLSLSQQYLAVMWAKAAYNDTHWGMQRGGAAADRLLFSAIGATNPATAQRLWNQVQELQYNTGGVIIFANADAVDAVSPKIRGLRTTAVENLNGYRFQDAWIA
jgi:peptide/nickel transport system substrate-binding protein